MPADELAEREEHFDYSRTLIFDDVGHTGGTQYMVMKMLGIEARAATHAFMLGNTGIHEGKPAVVRRLQEHGVEHVVFAYGFASPHDKIWHIEDLHGGKQRPWTEQVNPLLSYQPKFRQFVRPDVQIHDLLFAFEQTSKG